jgi:nitrogen fixation NifU-like protein
MAMPPADRDLFPQQIVDHYEDPYHRGPVDQPTHAQEAENQICGDLIRIELRVHPQGVVEEAWFDGQGCVASQAAASILVEQIEGKTVEQLRSFSANDMLALIGSDLPPNRQKCLLLAWRVLQHALDSPLDDGLDDLGPSFGGPSLREEC